MSVPGGMAPRDNTTTTELCNGCHQQYQRTPHPVQGASFRQLPALPPHHHRQQRSPLGGLLDVLLRLLDWAPRSPREGRRGARSGWGRGWGSPPGVLPSVRSLQRTCARRRRLWRGRGGALERKLVTICRSSLLQILVHVVVYR